MIPIVRVTNLTKSFSRGSEKIQVLDNLVLEVPKGQFLALMGPSGSGKTTLLNLIAGLDSPTSGSIVVGDQKSVRCLKASWHAGARATWALFFNFITYFPC